MKKFLFVTLSAVVITLAGCLVNTATAAVSYYAYSNNGTDYYLISTRRDQANTLYVWLNGVRNERVVERIKYAYFQKNGANYFVLVSESGGYTIGEGYVSSNGAASNVYDIVLSGKFNAAVQKDIAANKEVEKQKQLALDEQKNKAEPLLEEAFEYFKKNQYNKTIELQKKAIEVAPDYVPSYVELAFMYSRLNNHQQGINLLNNAILNRNLRDANLFFTRGQIFEMMNNLSEAGKDYREALNICENGELRHNIQQAQQRLWSKSF